MFCTVRYHLARRTVGTCGLSLCAVTTLQLLYGTLHIMVLYRRLSSTQRQLMRSPIPTLVVPGPLPLYYHEGGEGESFARSPPFPRGYLWFFGLSAGSLRCIGYYHEGGRGRALLDPLLSQGGIFASLGYRRDRSVV